MRQSAPHTTNGPLGGDGGWFRQTSGSSSALCGVIFSDAAHGWAVGEGGAIRATTNGGGPSGAEGAQHHDAQACLRQARRARHHQRQRVRRGSGHELGADRQQDLHQVRLLERCADQVQGARDRQARRREGHGDGGGGQEQRFELHGEAAASVRRPTEEVIAAIVNRPPASSSLSVAMFASSLLVVAIDFSLDPTRPQPCNGVTDCT